MHNASIGDKLTTVPGIMTFLGAGASHPLGYPTTKEFVKDLKNSFGKNRTYGSILLDDILSKIDPEMDVERILEVVESVSGSLNNHPTDKFFRNFDSRFHLGGSHQDINTLLGGVSELKEKVEGQVFDTYRWKPEKLADAKKLYIPFLNMIKDRLDSHDGIFIFTTNYDQVIEEVGISLAEYDIVDGFEQGRGGKNFWKPLVFNSLSDKPTLIKLFKLHGSLDWRERTDQRLEKIGAEERTLGTSTYRGNILIYPTLSHKTNHTAKYLSDLYEMFVSAMEATDCCVVIGYSFRDEHINKVFSDFLNRKRTELITVSPSVERNVRQNLLKEEVAEDEKIGLVSERRSKDKGSIVMINRKFGEDDTNNFIRKYLDKYVNGSD